MFLHLILYYMLYCRNNAAQITSCTNVFIGRFIVIRAALMSIYRIEYLIEYANEYVLI